MGMTGKTGTALFGGEPVFRGVTPSIDFMGVIPSTTFGSISETSATSSMAFVGGAPSIVLGTISGVGSTPSVSMSGVDGSGTVPVSNIPSSLMTDMLVFYEGEDNTDSHTNGLDLVAVGTPTHSTGNNGDAIYTTSGGNYYRVLNANAAPILSPGLSDMTVAFFYYIESTNSSGSGLVTFGGNFGGGEEGFKITPQTDKWELLFQDDTTQIKLSTDASSLTDNEWGCLVITYDRSGNMTCYKNGFTSIGSSSISALSAADIQPSQDFIIGATYNLTSSDSRVDNFAMWDRVLTEDEINDFYNDGFGTTYAELFNQKGAETQYNLSDLTEENGLAPLTNVNGVTFVTGKNGNGANFVTASSQLLTSESLIYKNIEDEDFCGWGWFKLNSVGQNHGITGQSTSSYHLHVLSSDKLRFRINTDGGAKILTHGDTLSISTWYFYVFKHDKDNDLISLSINGGTAETLTTSGDVLLPNTIPLRIGGIATANYADAVFDGMGFRRGGLLTPSEEAFYYNSGAGVFFE